MSPHATNAEVSFWLERLQRSFKPEDAATVHKLCRRRRWLWAKREMAVPGGFFCEEEMKHRDPGLFHRLVGRYTNAQMNLSAPMQGSLSTYLMQRLERDL